MNEFNTIVALLGGTIILLGLLSKKLAGSPVPPTLLALATGVLLGPEIFNLINLEEMGDRSTLLERAARLTLGIGLVAVALRVPRDFPRREWRGMLVVVALGMLLMWAVSTGLVYFIMGLPLWLAALIAAIITPTDPITATAVVTGSVAEENIPQRVRDTISFESGANDGLSYLFVFLPFLMLTRPASEAFSHWLTHTLLWEVGMATIFGLALGYAAGKLLQAAERGGTIKRDWRLIYTVALSLLAVGVGRLINSDEVLLVFAAGAMFTQTVSGEDRKNEEQGQEAVNRFFVVPIFVLLGTALPWSGWASLGWSGIVLVCAILLLRRPPVILLLRPFVPTLRSRGDALFVGWFGPIAVAAAYYAMLMEKRIEEPVIWNVVSLVVCGSIIAHGISSAPITRLYGRLAGLRSQSEADSLAER
jgi:NhaP-type Na+/H+ or K+/H+ antiporter